jgi:enamine deaminase RidA (YjgF/YER057c/UK114 family)
MGEIERHGSGGPFERTVGYSRVIRAGDLIVVAGTTALMPDGVIAGIGDPYLQTRQTLENVASALERVGAGLADVIRTRAYLTDVAHFEGFARGHAEAFGDIRPVNTTVIIEALPDPRMLVELEVDAYAPAAGG